VRTQIALIFEDQPNLKIYRAWQEQLGTYQMIVREVNIGYLFSILYSENNTNNKRGMLVIWDYGMLKDLGMLKLFNLKDKELDNK
jgi:hypothetical protein